MKAKILIFLTAFLISLPVWATCNTNRNVTTVQAVICAPTAGTVPATFHFSGASSSKYGMRFTTLTIDGKLYGTYYTPYVANVELDIALPAGTHHLAYEAFDWGYFNTTTVEDVTIGSGGGGTHNTTANLTWKASPSPGVDSYIVYRSLSSGTGYAMIATTAATSFVDAPGLGTFYYVVTAVNAAQEESAYGNEAKATLK